MILVGLIRQSEGFPTHTAITVIQRSYRQASSIRLLWSNSVGSVGVVVMVRPVLFDSLLQTGDPLLTVVRGIRQHQHIAGQQRIVVD